MNVIPDILAVTMAGLVPLIRAVVMIVADIGFVVMAVADYLPHSNGCRMIDSVHRMRMRCRAEQESYSKQKPTKHIKRSKDHLSSLSLQCGVVKSVTLLMLIWHIGQRLTATQGLCDADSQRHRRSTICGNSHGQDATQSRRKPINLDLTVADSI